MAILSYGEYISKFYLVVNWEKILPNLKSAELIGLKGISANRKGIAKGWLDIRNVLIEMDSKKVEKLNDVEPIQYENADYLVKNNLKIINRICQNPDKLINGNVNPRSRVFNTFRSSVESAYNNQLNFIKRTIPSKSMRDQVRICFEYFDMYYFNLEQLYEKEKFYTNNINDLAKFTYENIPNIEQKSGSWFKKFNFEDFSLESWKNFYKLAVLLIASHFKHEAEWIVNSEKFTIPKGSKIYIKVKENKALNVGKYETYNEEKEKIIQDIKANNLDNLYTFEFIGSYKDI